jgi:hypothetical protein
MKRWHKGGWDDSSIDFVYKDLSKEVKVSRLVSSTLVVDKNKTISSTQTETKEVHMKSVLLVFNLKCKWVVALSVLATLGLYGANLTQLYATSM